MNFCIGILQSVLVKHSSYKSPEDLAGIQIMTVWGGEVPDAAFFTHSQVISMFWPADRTLHSDVVKVGTG